MTDPAALQFEVPPTYGRDGSEISTSEGLRMVADHELRLVHFSINEKERIAVSTVHTVFCMSEDPDPNNPMIFETIVATDDVGANFIMRTSTLASARLAHITACEEWRADTHVVGALRDA